MPGRGTYWSVDGTNKTGVAFEQLDSALQSQVTGPGSGAHVIQDAGTPFPFQQNLNFLNAVSVVDNPGNNSTDVDVGGAGGSVLGPQQFPVPANAIYPSATAGTVPANAIAQRSQGTFGQQIKYIEFPTGVISEATYDWYPPRNWDPAANFSKVDIIIYWTSEAPTLAGQGPDFQVLAVARGQGQPIGNISFGNAPIQFTQVLSGLNELQTEFKGGPTIQGGPSKGDWVQFKFRYKAPGTLGAAGNMAGPFQLLGLRLQYVIDAETSSGL